MTKPPTTPPPAPLTREQAEANKSDREMAQELIDFMRSSFNWPAGNSGPCQRPRFWEEIIRLCQAELVLAKTYHKFEYEPAPVSTGNSAGRHAKMSYEEAMHLGGTFFPRGIYSETGTETCPIRDCPAWYVNQWAHGDDFTQSLRRYVASEYYQQQPELKAPSYAAAKPRSVS